MKIYTKIVLDKNDNKIKEEYFYYQGIISHCGIHYDFKSTRGAKAMEKQAKREKKLADRRAKKQAKAEEKGVTTNKDKDKTIPINQVVTLEHLTNPEKK